MTSVEVADIDGDGDLDVVSASEFADVIAWHENRCANCTRQLRPPASPGAIVPSSPEPPAVRIGGGHGIAASLSMTTSAMVIALFALAGLAGLCGTYMCYVKSHRPAIPIEASIEGARLLGIELERLNDEFAGVAQEAADVAQLTREEIEAEPGLDWEKYGDS